MPCARVAFAKTRTITIAMAVQRLQKELKNLNKEPLPGLRARPHPNNILEWHYCLEGASDTPYAGGVYHGKIVFPSQYPFRPPSITMVTPSGRFQPNTRLCLSMSDYHPETWNPMWSVSSILSGLVSFMYDTTPTTGSVNSTLSEKRQLAAASMAANQRNATFRKLFPEVIEEQAAKRVAEEAAAEAGGGWGTIGAGRGGAGAGAEEGAVMNRGGLRIREAVPGEGATKQPATMMGMVSRVAVMGLMVAIMAVPLYSTLKEVM